MSLLAAFVPSLKFHHSHESPTKLVMGLHARLRIACCYALRNWPVLPVPVAQMPAVCDLPNKIRMLASDPLLDLLHMIWYAAQAARGCMPLDTGVTTTSHDDRVHSSLQAQTAIAAGTHPQPYTHITGCCVRMSVTLGRCTSCGYWLPDTAAAMGGAPEASASRASVNNTSSCLRESQSIFRTMRATIHIKKLMTEGICPGECTLACFCCAHVCMTVGNGS